MTALVKIPLAKEASEGVNGNEVGCDDGEPTPTSQGYKKKIGVPGKKSGGKSGYAYELTPQFRWGKVGKKISGWGGGSSLQSP